MTDITKTAKYAVIYAVGVFLNRAVSFIMLPIYTRFLSPVDYGTIELLTMTVDIFGMFASVGLTTAVVRFYYRYEKQEERNQVISTISFLAIIFYLLASSLGLAISDTLAKIVLDGSKESTLYFRLIFITFFLQGLVEISLMFIITQQKPIFYVIISTGKLFIQLR
jgi:O-antigen/teichoic acid export membrane protein